MNKSRLRPHACQVCGRRFPDDQLFDCKGNFPGVRKVFCEKCMSELEEQKMLRAIRNALSDLVQRCDDLLLKHPNLGVKDNS